MATKLQYSLATEPISTATQPKQQWFTVATQQWQQHFVATTE